MGVITTDIANRDKIKIKEKQGEIKEQDRKEKPFPILFFSPPSVSKPLPSAVEFRFAAFLSLFQMSSPKTDLSSQKEKCAYI